MKKWREENKERISKKLKENYRKNNPLLKKICLYCKKEFIPKKRKAINLANYYIKIPKGEICQLCNKLAKEKHHEDYDLWDSIVFLCVKCHNKLRRID